LRTPLAGVKISSDIIERYIDSLKHEELVYHTREINTAVREVESILDNLLLTMKIETQTLKLSAEKHDIVELCHQKIRSFRKELLVPRHIEFSASHEQLYCYVDAFLLQTALRNILTNAVNYSAPNTTIHVWLGIIRNQVRISVHNVGNGIAESEIHNTIKPFFRGKNAENTPGIGMGLFVSRHCIEVHDGTLDIKSIPGEETTVTISLPLLAA
jgi:signal transduction histidine kinase